jgi:DNA-directed RNA polymerase specialized sigma24 family protein
VVVKQLGAKAMTNAILEIRHDGSSADAWVTIVDYVQCIFPSRGCADREDAQQEALLSILENIESIHDPRGARGWLFSLCRRKFVDLRRCAAHRPTPSARVHSDRDGCPVAPEPELDADELAAFLDDIDRLVLEHVLAVDVKYPTSPEILHGQARATIMRCVYGFDSDEIVAALAWPEELTRDRIYKGTERGRAIVLAAMARMPAERRARWVEAPSVLRELLEERRADVGLPRQSRRKAA